MRIMQFINRIPSFAKINGATIAVAFAACMAFTGQSVNAQTTKTTTTQADDAQDTSTDFLSDKEWRALSHSERQVLMRRALRARFIPGGGAPSLDNLKDYVAKYASDNVYDQRYFIFDVTATPVKGSTGSLVLSGEVYPEIYRGGIENSMESLDLNVDENNIVGLPKLEAGQHPFGVSTTSAATLRKEPRGRAEQVNSVARGGWIRILRTANDNDVSAGKRSAGRHAPNADQAKTESTGDWILAQTMEGYIGFARKADFDMRDDYQLPDGMLKLPVKMSDSGTTIPTGVFVYGDPDAGWNLFSGEKLPASSSVANLRPNFTAEQIKKLMEPFMDTGYVWGGVTDGGIDCSGFSQFFMRTAGVMIPRDAVQQATGGLIVGWGKDAEKNAKPGDLIFFTRSSGRINHVAISLGGQDIIHSAGVGVHLSRLDEPRHGDPDEGEYGDAVLFIRRIAVR